MVPSGMASEVTAEHIGRALEANEERLHTTYLVDHVGQRLDLRKFSESGVKFALQYVL